MPGRIRNGRLLVGREGVASLIRNTYIDVPSHLPMNGGLVSWGRADLFPIFALGAIIDAKSGRIERN